MAAERAPKTIVRTTCPRDCYDACGVAVIERGDAIPKRAGDPDHAVSRGARCGKCALAYNGAWRDPAQWLLHPLKRVGAKGDGKFQPVTWDQAMTDIAKRLTGIVAADGPASIFHTHYT